MTALVFAPPISLGDVAPLSEAGSAIAGSMELAVRADHRHPRLTSAQTGTLDGSGNQAIMFTRTFTNEPAISVLAVENDTRSPPDFKVKQFMDDTGQPWVAGKPYGGCIVYGSRARALPNLSSIILIGPLITALSGYVPTEPAANVKFSIIALQAS